ncbi:hypothetical protein P7K49_013301, partial [Saguinus oedipus]
ASPKRLGCSHLCYDHGLAPAARELERAGIFPEPPGLEESELEQLGGSAPLPGGPERSPRLGSFRAQGRAALLFHQSKSPIPQPQRSCLDTKGSPVQTACPGSCCEHRDRIRSCQVPCALCQVRGEDCGETQGQ